MAPVQSQSISLLIVEDDVNSRDVIARLVGLKYPDYTIYTADNGKRGLEIFKEHTPGMVITDINMPEMDGIEMAREIKSLNTNATYIVMTAYSDKNYLEKFTEIGFCAYLMKPIDFKELFAMIDKCGSASPLEI